MATTLRRNDPCPCNSGRKYKSCCLGASSKAADQRTKQTLIIGAVGLIAAIIVGFTVNPAAGKLAAGATAVAAIAWWLFSDPPGTHGGSDPGAINFGN